MSEKTDQPRIVVGFSHSSASASALIWALREAQLRGAVIEPVHAWQWSGECRASYAPMGNVPRPDEEREAAGADTARMIADLAPHLAPIVAHGPAVQVLLRYSEGADLLVLGSRPYDPDSQGPLGPVLTACLARARCPVVVVTPEMVPPQRVHRPLEFAGVPRSA
ncbi:nucleotide-binding universal stress UspA family protein [Thermocatellispora tengchongensis]|uniref:Nucleotide-binding universal stress UspA family protein n=1 Tax=Thermocatellispora tengchongensis TaxID=1073253 RepID=A0A840P5H6_9ACTN|nr:universal stress protein [Thermocatellispora tengchongensis]MBB5136564.1 nucleotide-binding universal stress UspA family protein [Thermocatellispora tengchongensis]